MATVKPKLQVEIGHVLFIDVVRYSKLSVDEQRQIQQQLNEVVRGTEQFRATAEDKLITLPTGDGVALVFFTSPEAPVECAIQISSELKSYPHLQLRMGIHSGPVSRTTDLNQRTNVAGAGINFAQRVMDCGDAGHILLSKHTAEDIEHYAHWKPWLHDLGEVEVKHGVRVPIANFYSAEVGNSQLPEKFKQAAQARRLAVKRQRKKMLAGAAAAVVAIGSSVGLWVFFHQSFLRSPPASEKSIAVLPFVNLSDEKENAYFADGVQDEILTDLARIADLKVISRTSVMPYKAGSPRNLREIGQQLGVAHVLEGSVQRAGGKVRVNAQLIDARNDKHLWAKTYDREIADVFALESELAQLIATEMQAKLSASEKASIEEKPTQDLAAYDFYVRATPLVEAVARSSTPEKDLSTAVDLLNQAIARDPSFLLAWCRLANAHDQIYFQEVDRTPARLAMAKSAIDSAFRLKPDSGEAHLALATHLYYGYFDFDRARAELAIAQQTLPNNSEVYWFSGIIDRRQSRWSEAVRNLERASQLDPRNLFKLMQLSGTYWQMRDYEQANNVLTRIQALDPNSLITRTWPGLAEIDGHANTQRLQEEIEKILAEDPALAESNDIKRPRFLLAWWSRDLAAADQAVAALPRQNSLGDDSGYNRDFWVGVIARLKGDAVAARAAFTAERQEREKRVRAAPDLAPLLSGLGVIDAALGRKDEAIREARQAIELAPIAKNSLHGVIALTDFALICVWTGEHDLAIEQLQALTKIPGGPTYGDLRLNPFWDPLRSDSRFEKIVQSLAPKDAGSK